MSTEEWNADNLSKLLSEELRISTLSEIKNHLQTLPSHKIKPLVNSLDLPLVFDCLNDSNSEQVNLACEVLSLCLDNLNVGESANRYAISLERALAHPYPQVKLMVLKEIGRNVKNEDVLVDLCEKTSLLASIIRCLASEELAVASETSTILTIVGCSDIGMKQLTSADSKKIFAEVQSTNELNSLRVFELFINISKESVASFQCLNAAGLISPIINDLNNNDILLRLNIIELLSQFGLSEHGFQYLESQNVMYLLSEMMKSTDILSRQLIEPGILRFFGNIGHWKPKEIAQRYPFVLKKMFENIETLDFSLLGPSIDAIAHIAEYPDGKRAIDSLGIVEGNILNISEKLASLPTEVTLKTLNLIESLLTLKDGSSEVSAICRKWYFALGSDPLTGFILKYAKNPFAELRIAGLNIILAISNQIWGQEIIKYAPGVIEFLLDRSAETHKECKEVKYEIVKTLSKSSEFEQAVLNKLDTYVREGPFYVQGIMEVAFEGND